MFATMKTKLQVLLLLNLLAFSFIVTKPQLLAHLDPARMKTTANFEAKNDVQGERGNNVTLCTVLNGGLTNQMMKWFGLILMALKTPGTNVCVPDVLIDYPFKTGEGTKRKKTHKSLTEYVDFESAWHPSLPELTYNITSSTVVKDIPGRECWESYEKYINKFREKVRSGGTVPRRRLERIFFKTLLHPTPPMVQIMETSLPKKYIAIHARVEKDMRNHGHFTKHGHELDDILNIMDRDLRDVEITKETKSTSIVAVGFDLVDKDNATLSAAKTPWGGSLQRIEKPASLEYFGSSLLDFNVCVRASLFVGFSGSTLSNVVSFLRDDAGTTFDYSQGQLVERTDNGIVPFPSVPSK